MKVKWQTYIFQKYILHNRGWYKQIGSAFKRDSVCIENWEALDYISINGQYQECAIAYCPHLDFLPNFFSLQYYWSSWSRGNVPSSHARGQRFEPRRRQYLKLLLDQGYFHSNPMADCCPSISLKQCFGH